MNRPFFSIIVVSLNAEKTIAQTINSILTQTFENFEIIVKDGNSIDKTIENIPKDSRIRIISQKDFNVYDGMNQATKYINGNYIFYLNCGDRFYNDNVLQTVFNKANMLESLSLIYGDVYQEDWGKVIKQNKPINKYFWYRTTLCHQSVFFPSEFLNGDSTYNTKYTIAADFALLFELFMSNRPFEYLDEIIAVYEGAGLSASKEGVAKNKEQKKEIINSKYNVIQKSFYFFKKCVDHLLRRSFV